MCNYVAVFAILYLMGVESLPTKGLKDKEKNAIVNLNLEPETSTSIDKKTPIENDEFAEFWSRPTPSLLKKVSKIRKCDTNVVLLNESTSLYDTTSPPDCKEEVGDDKNLNKGQYNMNTLYNLIKPFFDMFRNYNEKDTDNDDDDEKVSESYPDIDYDYSETDKKNQELYDYFSYVVKGNSEEENSKDKSESVEDMNDYDNYQNWDVSGPPEWPIMTFESPTAPSDNIQSEDSGCKANMCEDHSKSVASERIAFASYNVIICCIILSLNIPI